MGVHDPCRPGQCARTLQPAEQRRAFQLQLQAWLQSRQTGEPCPPTVGRAPFPEESIIMGRCDTLKTLRGKRGGQTAEAPDMSD